MSRHVVDPPENVHLSRDEVLESVARRRGITVEELKRRREVAGLDSAPEKSDDASEEATIEG
ncbi:hypothetical protein NGM10_07255 [Halorussus salilacus]|uniref:hypothetical protein n=1 Tax=Halorussus salilacus TaxID=2953750 RepID=UPI00209E791E|nr:hypothetical protein [Halorussus salilacus]USZ69524.1 hypothetical protein NGM10_07255 [Halorussus salilacus]